MAAKPITAIFAGYDRLFREGMRLLLGERFDILQYVESFENALNAMRAGNTNIDLLIGDPGSNMLTELNAISSISREFSQTKVVVLAQQIDRIDLNTLLESGAGGVLSSNISVTALLCSIEIVLLGERIIPTILSSGGVTPSAAQSFTLTLAEDATDLGDSLSARERQILYCLVDGLPNKSIARNLGMTESTVKVHLKMLLRKLRIQNRTQAAIWALNHGFFATEEQKILAAELGTGSISRTRSKSVKSGTGNGQRRIASDFI
jgi:two-component system nitrate/nitrite response regulator NarL